MFNSIRKKLFTINGAIGFGLVMLLLFILFLLNSNNQLLDQQNQARADLADITEIKNQFLNFRINSEEFVIMLQNRSKAARDTGYQQLRNRIEDSIDTDVQLLAADLEYYYQQLVAASTKFINDDRMQGTLLLNISAKMANNMTQVLDRQYNEHSQFSDQIIMAVNKSNEELKYAFYLLMAGIFYLQWSRNKTLKGILQEVEHYRDNLKELVRERTEELENAQEELLRKQRLAAIGQLTATVSHELRNPLGSIRNSLAVIYRLADKDNSMMRNAMEITERGVKRCDNIITELLDFTRYRELKQELTDIDVWLNRELDDYPHAPEIELVRELNSGLTIVCDRERLLLAVLNALNNSCDAVMPEDGLLEASKSPRVTVSTRSVEDYAEIEIADNGVGIPLEIKAKIFEPLFSTKSFGVGLGMPLVKQIVEQHGGTVDIDSEPSIGTKLRLKLPLQKKEETV